MLTRLCLCLCMLHECFMAGNMSFARMWRFTEPSNTVRTLRVNPSTLFSPLKVNVLQSASWREESVCCESISSEKEKKRAKTSRSWSTACCCCLSIVTCCVSFEGRQRVLFLVSTFDSLLRQLKCCLSFFSSRIGMQETHSSCVTVLLSVWLLFSPSVNICSHSFHSVWFLTRHPSHSLCSFLSQAVPSFHLSSLNLTFLL